MTLEQGRESVVKMHQQIKDPSGLVHFWVVDFERILLDEQIFSSLRNWMWNWWWLSIIYALFYILAVFAGRSWMARNNRKYELRPALILWNTILTIFSLWGVIRCVPEVIYTLTHHGIKHSICDTTYMKGITGLWIFLFMFSKVPETIDTLFIVLRRQPLIFLHWYHHASVLVYCFYSYASFASTGRWFVSMNYCVHTIMYGYFALRAARIHVSRSIQALITVLQIVQMIVGCIINIITWKYKQEGYLCETTTTNIQISLALYASYFILFAHFFYITYLGKNLQRKSKERKD